MEQEKSVEDFYRYDEEYRNNISTVDAEGKRRWVFVKKQGGKIHTARVYVAIALLSVYLVGPFLKWNGHPLFLFNFFDRKFILFGYAFWPQDFFLLAIFLIIFFVFIIVFTVAFGRSWCGWACPQTLFLEMVFRKIEYLIEGDAPAQRRLKKAPWEFEKIWKKGLKHFVFLLISVLISHVALAYLISLDEVIKTVTTSPAQNPGGFISIIIFTGIFYAVFAWFREQACIAVCPYGRLQGVLLGKESLVVIYDWLRGEPRAKITKGETLKQGDCIDCKLCIHVCPTGIDIRNGTQLECVNCGACSDACDEVMDKIDRPRGLIRLSSPAGIEKGRHKIFTPRVVVFSGILVLLLSLLTFLITTRAHVQVTVLKVPGTLYTRTDEGLISNVYNLVFINKTFHDLSLEVKIESPADAVITQLGNTAIPVPKEGLYKSTFMVKMQEHNLTGMTTEIVLGLYEQGQLISREKAKFIGPFIMKKKKP